MNDFETAEDGEKSLGVEMAEELVKRILADSYMVNYTDITETATNTVEIEIGAKDYAQFQGKLKVFDNFGFTVSEIDFQTKRLVLENSQMR